MLMLMLILFCEPGLHLDLIQYVSNYEWECTDCKMCMKCKVRFFIIKQLVIVVRESTLALRLVSIY